MSVTCKCGRVLPFPSVTVRTLCEWIKQSILACASRTVERQYQSRSVNDPLYGRTWKCDQKFNKQLRPWSRPRWFSLLFSRHRIIFGYRHLALRDASIALYKIWALTKEWVHATGCGITIVVNWRDHVWIVGVAADVAAGVTAQAHAARGARGLQRAWGGRWAGATPLANC